MPDLRVDFNPATRVALVQDLAAAVPGGSTNIGTFTPVPGQLVYFHHVRDLLYKRTQGGAPGFFPGNVTDMQRIEIRRGATPPDPPATLAGGTSGSTAPTVAGGGSTVAGGSSDEPDPDQI
jgi:hypothetical protein